MNYTNFLELNSPDRAESKANDQFTSKFELQRMQTNSGIMSLIQAFKKRELLVVSLTNIEIRAILYYMVDYWALYLEQQDPEYMGRTLDTGKKGKKQGEGKKSKQIGIWNLKPENQSN